MLTLCDQQAEIYTCSTDHTHLILLEDNQQTIKTTHLFFQKTINRQSKQHTYSFRRQSTDNQNNTLILSEDNQWIQQNNTPQYYKTILGEFFYYGNSKKIN